MKLVWCLLLGGVLSWLSLPLKALEIDIKRNPEPREWRYFLRNGLKLQQNIWEAQRHKGVAFADWSWGWRILWLKSCGQSQLPHCKRIMSAGLSDAALVVRAEAITQLGLRHQNSRNQDVLDTLKRAALEPRNFRNGKPMFIHQNIKLARQRITGHASNNKIKTPTQHEKLAKE